MSPFCAVTLVELMNLEITSFPVVSYRSEIFVDISGHLKNSVRSETKVMSRCVKVTVFVT
jgi:hypothetical protein